MNNIVKIFYTNWRGESAVRKIIPEKIWFGSTEYHKEEQWILDALDIEKNEKRSFAMKDIHWWGKEE